MTPATDSPLCTENDIVLLVRDFYASVRRDDMLGPVFEAHVDDWDKHLVKLVHFWSSILLRTGRYTGNPMQKHVALPGLNPALFERWLALFQATTAAHPNQAMAREAYAAAQRIARSLWFAYQMKNAPHELPKELSPQCA